MTDFERLSMLMIGFSTLVNSMSILVIAIFFFRRR